jgi:hypothetical protein
LNISGFNLRSDDGFEFFSILPNASNTILRYDIIDNSVSGNIRNTILHLNGNWTHVIKSRSTVKCNLIQNNGEFRIIHYNGTFLNTVA